MKKSDFCLFFSMPLDELDWRNLAASHVTRVMLPLDLADVATLDRLRSMGVRVVLRVGEDRYYSDDAPARIVNQVQACQNHCSVVVVIVGVEPEHGINLHWGSPDWKLDRAFEHRRRFDAVRLPLQRAGFQVASPGWTYDVDAISEDGQPAPGRVAWREIVTQPVELTPGAAPSYGYSDANFNAFHMYQFNYGEGSVVDMLRVKFGVKFAQELYHKPLGIDEINVNQAPSPLEAMRACLRIASMLLTHPLGARVAWFTPFVSNGNGVGWPVGYLMRDPQCYVELGRWMGQIIV